MTPSLTKQKGFAAFYSVILVLSVSLIVALGIARATYNQQRVLLNEVEGLRAYFAAESGIEDALLRLRKGLTWTNPYVFSVEGASTTVTISNVIGGARTITSEGNARNRVRRERAVYQLDTVEVEMHFGAQIGDGGLDLAHNGAEIKGNVFSNGNVTGKAPATITNSLVVSGEGGTAFDITVLEDVEAHSCSGATVNGNLEYNSGGTNSCEVSGSTTTMADVILPQDFPITDDMISDWKNDAESGSVTVGNYSVNGSETLGPVKIDGNLFLDNNAVLTLNGTIWVTGSLTSNPNATIELHDNYGDVSGILMVDGTAEVANNLILKGSGNPASFLALISLSFSLDEDNPAIKVSNNADNAILFARNGVATVLNNATIVEVMAYRLVVRNATVEYDIGLADTRFSSGPGGGWKVTGWREVE